MEVKTFTQFWNMEKKLYAIEDVPLPFAIPLKVIGMIVLFGIPWWLLMWVFQVPFGNPGYLFWLLPPGIVGFLSSRPLAIFQRKTLIGYVKSMSRYYFMQAKRYAGLRPMKYKLDTDFRLLIRVFKRNEASK